MSDAALPRALSLSRAGYYTDFVLAPLAALTLVHFELYRRPSAGMLAWIAAGVVLWTLAEYLIHRFAFHGPLRALHDVHHRRPAAYIGVASWGTAPLFALVWLMLIVATSAPIANPLMAGLLAGYTAYIVIHDRMHHGDRAGFGRIMRALLDRHIAHHRGGHANFGVSSPLFDLIFRTYR